MWLFQSQTPPLPPPSQVLFLLFSCDYLEKIPEPYTEMTETELCGFNFVRPFVQLLVKDLTSEEVVGQPKWICECSLCSSPENSSCHCIQSLNFPSCLRGNHHYQLLPYSLFPSPPPSSSSTNLSSSLLLWVRHQGSLFREMLFELVPDKYKKIRIWEKRQKDISSVMNSVI